MPRAVERPLKSDRHDGGDATRTRLLEAAVRCVLRWGVAKTGVGDIAREAGCSRQTFYNHFDDADAIIREALLVTSNGFADRMITGIRAYPTPEERIVEAMLFVLTTLPSEPFLRLVADPAVGPLVGASLFTSDASRALVERVAAACVETEPALAPRVPELSEMMTRLVLSFLVLPDAAPRDEEGMRRFLVRWLLPGLRGPGAEGPAR